MDFDLFRCQYRWQHYPKGPISMPLRHWLYDKGSLTARLNALAGRDIEVRVLDQSRVYWQLPGISPHKQAWWSRKVALSHQGEVWVLAHSLVPFEHLVGPVRQLIRLGNRPLGQFLFNHHSTLRAPIKVARIGGNYARCSVFTYAGQDITVAEYFHPNLIKRIHAGQSLRLYTTDPS